MILLAHLLLGAVVGSYINNIGLAIILALLCHYFLDVFPHIEYSIDNIRNKNWKKSWVDIIKVLADFLLGMVAIFLFSKNQPMIYLCAFIALVPDAMTIISSLFPNKVLALHDNIHTKKVHYLTKQKNFPFFWKIFSQAVTIIVCIVLLKI